MGTWSTSGGFVDLYTRTDNSGGGGRRNQGNIPNSTKIITSMPKLAGQAGNTQFIVVSPQSSAGATSQLASLSFSLSLGWSAGLEEKFESLSCRRVPAFFWAVGRCYAFIPCKF